VAQHPTIDFIFVGPNHDQLSFSANTTHSDKEQIQEQTNVFFLPEISSSSIMSFLLQADLLLISYQEKYLVDQSNPHKMLEYLYSGKPIVATYTNEYANKNLMYMSEKNKEWLGIFNDVVKNLLAYSSSDLIEKRRNFALENTYDKQIDRIGKLINEH